MKSASQITVFVRRGEAEINLCSQWMRMSWYMYRIEITCHKPSPEHADTATV